ncbi:MAG: SLC13 family permease [Veillonella sp.]|nr:SLC13 family permease [Veillonella sp.]
MMLDALIIGAIVLSIVLGYKTKINTGLYSIVFTYLIGVLAMGIQPSDIIRMWPITIFFVIFSISLFYNFAIDNGTLGNLAQHMLYRTRNAPHMLPIVVFLASTVIASLGAGFFAVMAFFAPITIMLCKKAGLNPLLGAIAVNYGALAGNGFIISPGGVVFIGLMEHAGISEMAVRYEMEIFIASIVVPIIVLFLLNKVFKRTAVEDTANLEKPKAFTRRQKITLGLIAALIITVLLFPVLSALMPSVTEFKAMENMIDVGLVAIVFTVIGLILKVGTEKSILANVPWGTLIMICGVGMLISLAVKAGTVKMVASLMTDSLPTMILPIAITILAGIMGFFSSTMGVIAPALFPLVPMISSEVHLDPGILFLAIIMGAQATVISPISSGGSLIVAAVPEQDRNKMFNDLLFKAGPICLLASVICVAILYII